MSTYPLLRETEDRTKSWWLIALIGVVTIAFLGFAQSAEAKTDQYKHNISVKLTGQQEVPAVTTSMTGRLITKLSDDENDLSYRLMVNRGQGITAAHFHCGSRGENGPPIVNLYPEIEGMPDTYTYTTSSDMMDEDMRSLVASGLIDDSDLLPAASDCSPNIRTVAHLAQAMREGRIYVNVHTTRYPNGEIRAQAVFPHMYGNTGNKDYRNPNANGYELIGMAHDLFSRIQVEEVSSPTTSSKRFMITIPNDVWDNLVRAFMEVRSALMSM